MKTTKLACDPVSSTFDSFLTPDLDHLLQYRASMQGIAAAQKTVSAVSPGAGGSIKGREGSKMRLSPAWNFFRTDESESKETSLTPAANPSVVPYRAWKIRASRMRKRTNPSVTRESDRSINCFE